MKIAVYEMREDEREKLNQLETELDVQLVTTEKTLNSDTIDLAAGCQGVTTLGQSVMDRKMMALLKEKGIQYYSTRSIGYNHVDLNAAQEYGIFVSNASYPPNAVADYTVMLILMALRKYKPAMWRQQVNDYSLGGLIGRNLRDMTVGIVGTGRIGRAVIENLSGFGCRILAYDVYPSDEVKTYAVYTDMDTIYHECDIIALHTPLLDSTYHMINKRTIAKMKQGVILVNCARGELMDIAEVIAGIESEKIGSVALDVIENENGIYHYDRRCDILKNRDMAYLRQFPNVIMTQHMAFYTKESVDSMVQCGIESLVAFSKGENYPNRIC